MALIFLLSSDLCEVVVVLIDKDNPLLVYILKNWKVVILLDKDKLQSTLFVGIDVSSNSNYAFAMDFFGTKFFSFSNNQPGSNVLINNVSNCLKQNNF